MLRRPAPGPCILPDIARSQADGELFFRMVEHLRFEFFLKLYAEKGILINYYVLVVKVR
jgi:hypothetical protein